MQRFLYLCLFVLTGLSLFQFLKFTVANDFMSWESYSIAYLGMFLASTWYFFILLFLGDVRRRVFPSYDGSRISVLVPSYNEHPNLLRACIDSVMNAKGNKEVIVIDDGSKNGLQDVYVDMKLKYGDSLLIRSFSKNQGKRHAMHHAVTKLISHSKYVVTIDSDTVLDPDALIRVVEPLLNSKIGAATGDVRLFNEGENWLTRMQAAYYWVGINFYKKAQSAIGIVVCCSGCLAAYRTHLLEEIIDRFVEQEFFGEKCTHSEDRHLTNLVLERGYEVVFVPTAISFTHSPTTVKGFLKQQQRWKRGYIRESLYTLTWAWRSRRVLFFETLLWDLTAPFLSFGLRIAMIVTLFTNLPFFVLFILPGWVLCTVVRNILVFMYAPEKIKGLFTYAVFYEIFLYWMNIYALFTVKNRSWITR